MEEKTRKQVIIDTNFLLIPARFKVDIFTEIDRIMKEPHEICILDKTIDELEKIIKEQRGKDKEAAKLGKKIAEAKKIHILKTDKLKNVDRILIEKAEKDKFIVATQDAELKKELKNKGIKIITLRKKKHLTIEE